MTRIALNGIGRIGKLVLRDLIDSGAGGEIVLLNDPVGDAEQHALLMEFDSVHGRWKTPVAAADGALMLNGQTIRLTHEKTIEALPLAELGVDDRQTALIAQEPAAHWTLYPEWNQHDWGSPTWITVQVQPGLNEFIAKAADRGIKVSFCGNINPMRIFLKGTPAQVYDATRHCMAIGGPRSFSAGGCEIPMPTPDANVYAQNRALASLSNGRATSEA